MDREWRVSFRRCQARQALADVFALQNDGTIAAINSDGTTAWVSDVSAYVGNSFANWTGVRADFQGGLVLSSSTPDCFSFLGTC